MRIPLTWPAGAKKKKGRIWRKKTCFSFLTVHRRDDAKFKNKEKQMEGLDSSPFFCFNGAIRGRS